MVRVMLREPPPTVRTPLPGPPPKAPHRSHIRFHEAFRGLKRGMRGQSRFAVHLFVAAAAVAACVALDCRVTEWCLVALCVGVVLTAELFRSALEALVQGLDVEARRTGALAIAAGAALMAGLFAVLVGGIVFVNRFGELMRWWG
jgi:diacylglycerol kinase